MNSIELLEGERWQAAPREAGVQCPNPNAEWRGRGEVIKPTIKESLWCKKRSERHAQAARVCSDKHTSNLHSASYVGRAHTVHKHASAHAPTTAALAASSLSLAAAAALALASAAAACARWFAAAAPARAPSIPPNRSSQESRFR